MRVEYAAGDVTLLFCELQPFVLRGDKTVAESDLTKAVAAAVEIATALEIPVISSTVPPGPPGAEVEMIAAVRRYPPVIRTTVGLLDDPMIGQTLEKGGRRTLAIGGVSSEIAILHSVLGARRRGYDVWVLTDCCAGLSQRTEAAAFRQMEGVGATLSNLSSFFTGMVPGMEHPTGQVVFSALARYWRWGARHE